MIHTSIYPPEPSTRVGFSGNRIDRQSENRPDDVLDKAVSSDRARYYIFHGDRAILDVSDAATPRFSRQNADDLGLDPGSVILLGYADDIPVLAATITNDPETLPASIKAVDLRSLAAQGNIAVDDLGAIAQARSYLSWHATHQFCSMCGARTHLALGGHRRDCPSCGRQHFPRTDPVVIMLAVHGDHCLLGRQSRFQDGMYSCLAGFMEPGETIEDAVRRETCEESGIHIGAVRYHASQPWPFASSLMIGCHAEALSREITMDEDELEDCRWFSREEVHDLLTRTHPDGLTCPPEFAIAHEIIRAFAERRTLFD